MHKTLIFFPGNIKLLGKNIHLCAIVCLQVTKQINKLVSSSFLTQHNALFNADVQAGLFISQFKLDCKRLSNWLKGGQCANDAR